MKWKQGNYFSGSKVPISCFFLCNSFSWWCVLYTCSSGFYGLRGQHVTGGISWGSSSGLVLLSSWECSRKQFSMQSSRISATQGNLVGSNCSLQFNWWGIALMAYGKLGWQMHVKCMITWGLFQNNREPEFLHFFLYCKYDHLCSSNAKMLLLSLTPECSVLGM